MSSTAEQRKRHREYVRAWRKRGQWLRDCRNGVGGPRDYEWRSPLHPRFSTVVLVPRKAQRGPVPQFVKE